MPQSSKRSKSGFKSRIGLRVDQPQLAVLLFQRTFYIWAMKASIDKIHESEYPEVVEVWEASVRATHTFLTEKDIAYFKPLILNEYLKAVELRSVRNEQGRIIGFLGVAEEKVEMLFIHPAYMGKGIGKVLMDYALNEMRATRVDVNEANPQAVGFYEHLGFKIISRSELDGLGKPFPILHLALSGQT
jgi:putative acetyltransferase